MMTALGVNDGYISSFGNELPGHGHCTKAVGSMLKKCVGSL